MKLFSSKASANPSPSSTTSSSPQGDTILPSPPPKKIGSNLFVRDRHFVRDRRSNSKSGGKQGPRSKPHPDSDTHPLNLPPEERRLLSAMSTMSESPAATTMEINQESPSSPIPAAPGAFPSMNGVEASQETTPPLPPPHTVPTSPPPQEPPADPDTYKAQGNKFFKLKQYDKAIEEYSKAVAINPKSPTYRSNRAAALISANRYAEALVDAKAADELDPGNEKILHRLARVYTSLGRPQEALDVYSRIQPPATSKDKAPAETMLQHVALAESALRDGTTGSMTLHALDQAERGLGLGVDRPRKWKLMRGEAYLKMGNVNALGDAQNVAMSLLRENSADPEALVLRGRALYAQDDNAKALQHFRQALNCDPDFAEAVKYLRMVQKLDRMKTEGNNLFKSGKFKEAAEMYTEALEIDPLNKGTNAKILQNRALCYTRTKDYSAAIADCDRAITLDPSYTKARLTRARALGNSGEWEAAVRELKAHAENNPSEPGLAKEIRNAELELKKSKRKDYYAILGVEKDCGDHEIKRAYRKLAIQHHPDKNIGVEGAEAKFKDIGEAYETLSDPQKRQRYDSGEDLIDPSEMFGGGMGGNPFGGMGGMQIDPEMLFNMMGGGMGGGRGGGGPTFSFSPGGMGGGPFGGGARRGGGFPF